MQPVEITYFTVTLFLALAALIKWKRRRDTVSARLNRGLRGYVDAKLPAELSTTEGSNPDTLIPV